MGEQSKRKSRRKTTRHYTNDSTLSSCPADAMRATDMRATDLPSEKSAVRLFPSCRLGEAVYLGEPFSPWLVRMKLIEWMQSLAKFRRTPKMRDLGMKENVETTHL